MLDRKTLKTIFELDPQEARKLWELLTPREREVAEKMAQGWSNRRIAEQFHISPKTLDIHRQHVKTKLEAKTAAGVAKIFFVLQLSQAKE